MDTQTIELIGQHRLASDLLRAGLEVAFPARARGVDLIAYADLDQQPGQFIAKPIQLRAAAKRSFGIWKKYLKVSDLILAFVWFVDESEAPETYALNYNEAFAIGETLGWTRTPSWNEKGVYLTAQPGGELLKLLEPHRMSPELWWAKVTGSQRTRRGAANPNE